MLKLGITRFCWDYELYDLFLFVQRRAAQKYDYFEFQSILKFYGLNSEWDGDLFFTDNDYNRRKTMEYYFN